MATPLVDAPFVAPARPAPEARPRRARFRPPDWLREPLLHFVLLGGLLFALDQALLSKGDDPQTIVVGADVNSEAVHTFEQARGRKPNAQELEALHRIWIDN